MQARLVTDYLDNSAKKFPNKTAFVDERRSLTFLELQREAQHIAQHLIDCNVFKQPVVVYLDKSVECIAAFMGIAYSGNFFTPIDTAMPNERISKIVNILEPARVITDKKHIEMAKEFSGSLCVDIYETLQTSRIDLDKIKFVCDRIIDTDLLYVLFTSGSTGIPKGVSISHKSVITYTEWFSDCFPISEHTIFGNQTPFFFSMSVTDIYQTLRNSCTLYIIPKILFTFPIKLLSFIQENQINTIYWVPSAYSLVANLKALGKCDIGCLKLILFAGEVMPAKQLNRWKKECPNAIFANLFGPTETTDICTYYICKNDISDSEAIPIGTKCKNTDVFVIDADDKLVEGTDIGELCVRGNFLSYGYYNNPEKTKEAFVQNPLNDKYPEIIYRTGDLVHYNEYGELMYDGRKDFQIKHMGHRIELGEIETAVSSLEGVDEVCCLFDAKRDIISLFYAGSKDVGEIVPCIRKLLPEYMIPEKCEKLPALPHNMNGKIDRVLLKQKL